MEDDRIKPVSKESEQSRDQKPAQLFSASNVLLAIGFYAILAVSFLVYFLFMKDIDILDQLLPLFMLLVLPVILALILPRLSRLRVGEVEIELKRVIERGIQETKNEVREQTAVLASKYEELGQQLAALADKSVDVLKPRTSLDVSLAWIEQIRNTVNTVHLSKEQISVGLANPDPSVRLPVYIELQERPRAEFYSQLIDCLWFELFYARRENETRSLWQLLQASGRTLETFSDIGPHEKHRARLVIQHVCDVLSSEPSLDRGTECQQNAGWNLGLLSS